ncbi:MAG: PQQ-binding-like beta-propeller repeat protein [Planctomycetaceae bacterium]
MIWRTSLFVVLSTMCVVQAQEWPQWRGPSRDGHSPDSKLELDWNAKEPKLLWVKDGTGSGYGSVAVSGEQIFAMGDKGGSQKVIAMNLGGEVLWETSVSEGTPKHGYPGSRCTPSVDGDRVYVVTSDGSIACLEVTSGELQWQKNFKREWGGKMMSIWGYSESPLVDGDWVLCTPGGKNAMVVALDKKTGAEVWSCDPPPSEGEGKDGAGYSSIVVSNGGGVKQYVTLVGRGLVGVRAEDGKLLWSYNQVANEVANIPTPICYGDFVFGSSGYDGGGSVLLKLSKAGDGVQADEEYWLDNRTLQNHHGGVIRVGDHAYLGHGHNKGFPTCIELATGKVVWGGARARGVGSGSAAISLVGENLVFRYESGELALVAANPKGYQLRGAIKPEYKKGRSWAHPVICGGKMYLREQNKLMCYEL